MRALIAAAIVVFLNGTLHAEPAAESWSVVHAAALREEAAGHSDEEMRLFRRSWVLAQSGDEQALSAEEIGIVLHRGGDGAQAKYWLERARAGFTDLKGSEEHLSRIDMLLGGIARDAGDYVTAEAFMRSSLAEWPVRNSFTASTTNALADLLREQGRDNEAAELFARVLRIDDLTPRQRIDALLGSADIERGLGAWQSSANKWNAAITEARNQGDGLDEAIGLRGLGSTWLDAGVPARAEPLLRQALALLKVNPAAPGEQTAGVLLRLGDLYVGENKLRLAEEAYEEALKLNRSLLGEEHPQTGRLLEDLAIVYSLRGDIATARDLAAQSVDLMTKAMGAGSLPVASSLSTQAIVETQAKDLSAAAEFYRQALEIARRYPGNQRMELMLIERYSAVMQAMHRGREAEALKSEAKTLSTYFKASHFLINCDKTCDRRPS